MKFSLFGIAAFAFIAVTQIVANPVDNTNHHVELVEKRDFADVSDIMTELISSVKDTDDSYKSICAGSCSSSHIKAWCKEIAGHCYDAIDKCKEIPSGHQVPDKDTCVSLVVELLKEIEATLKFLLSKAGLLGLLIGVLGLVSVLIAALNALLVELAIFVDGLLSAVSVLLGTVLGALGCLICTLGLVL